MYIPFNKSDISEIELDLVKKTLLKEKLEGGRSNSSEACIKYLKENFLIQDCLLTTSCTSALELSALVLKLNPGDEVILPSYTFVSSANAFVLRGCKPVFVDIRKEDLNLNLDLVEQAITKKTKALVVIHYGGISCDMKKAKNICKKYNLALIEDAAQAVGSKYKDLFLGSIGDMGAYSFHGTKNITCGEGGAILINKKKYLNKAQIHYEKGTNRLAFSLGKVSKYNWRDIGSSHILSNFSASLLLGQLRREKVINETRMNIWNDYNDFFSSNKSLITKYRICSVPTYATKHNGHLFFLIFNNKKMTNNFIKKMREEGCEVSKHYVPLHNSPFGKKVGRVSSSMKVTENAGDCLVRLPLWPGVEAKKIMLASSKIINKL
tara:strand:- start:17749 stop:18885 length:1137 start_codon:yes stop_codon:yes gene_type:complete